MDFVLDRISSVRSNPSLYVFDTRLGRSVRKFTNHVTPIKRVLGHTCTRVGVFLDPQIHGLPQTRTVVAALAGLAVFFIVGGVAVEFSNKIMLIIVIAIAIVVDSMIAAFSLADYYSRSVCDPPSHF